VDTALLVIDVQEEALEGCHDADGVVERINDLARRMAESGAPVIYIQHEDDTELIRDSPGWQLARGLKRPEGSVRLAKTFRDGFEATDLQGMLERDGVRRVAVTGVHSDFCVQTTALSALIRGFDLVLVSDGHTSRPTPESSELSGEALAQLVNARMSTLRYPGRSVEVVRAAELSL
jgi:nicotinamidase-related amidase